MAQEATVWCSVYQTTRAETAARVPIGKPIPHMQLYVLDEHLQPMPIGIPGELYIGGECLARGYVNQPELTQERFLSNPYAVGTRPYRTGDLARYRADGNLEFLGRIDQQVKLRGYRIELGEIAFALSNFPGVHHAAVLLREDKRDQQSHSRGGYSLEFLVPPCRPPGRRFPGDRRVHASSAHRLGPEQNPPGCECPWETERLQYFSQSSDLLRFIERMQATTSEAAIPRRSELLDELTALTLSDEERYMAQMGFKSRRQVFEESFYYCLAYHCFREFDGGKATFHPAIEESTGEFTVTLRQDGESPIWRLVVLRQKVKGPYLIKRAVSPA